MSESMKDGQIEVRSGKGIPPGKDGCIRFSVGDDEVLLFKPEGEVYVRGELVESNFEVFEAFKLWLQELRLLK